MHMTLSVWTYGVTHEAAKDIAAAIRGNDGTSEQTAVFGSLSLDQDFDVTHVGCVVAQLNAEGAQPSELLDRLAQRQSPLVVIYLCEGPTTKTIVDAMRRGAFDVIEWPAERDRLAFAIKHAVDASIAMERRLIEVRKVRQ
jgi:FixJ family two-component response regulator